MSKKEKDNSLVSIVVITYNSAKYILETLESAKAQTYQNIELIISDDCSTDNTVEFCNKWIKENKDRFIHTELLTSEINTGVSPNCNRGFKVSKGKWIKLFAGDDVLLENSIEDNINYISKNKEISFLFSDELIINEKSEFQEKLKQEYDKFNKNSRWQYRELLKGKSFACPKSCFIKREALIEVGGFDETIPMSEDFVLWINATKIGYVLYFYKNTTVKHRMHPKSIMNEFWNSKKLKDSTSNDKFKKSLLKIKKKYLLTGLLEEKMFFYLYSTTIHYLLDKLDLSGSKSYKYLKYLRLLDPTYLMVVIKNKNPFK